MRNVLTAQDAARRAEYESLLRHCGITFRLKVIGLSLRILTENIPFHQRKLCSKRTEGFGTVYYETP